MPNFKFIGALPRFYPDERDANSKSLMAELGTVHDWAVQPSDGQWVETDEAPVSVPEPAVEAPAPVEAPVAVPEAPEPAPAVVEPSEPVPAPAVQPEPVPVAPEPVQAPPAQPWTWPGFAPASQPYTR